jgi:diketogulonate reductase-like aldo/keto reductase
VAACHSKDVILEAYRPLGTGRHLPDPAVAAIAADVGRLSAQVLLRRSVQRSIPVISKSTYRDRIEENLRIFGFELHGEAMSRLDGLDHTGCTSRAIENKIKWW